MHLFETEEGDKWVCLNCAQEREKEILEKGWEFIFDKQDPVLRCSICKHGDYEYED